MNSSDTIDFLGKDKYSYIMTDGGHRMTEKNLQIIEKELEKWITLNYFYRRKIGDEMHTKLLIGNKKQYTLKT